LDLVLFFSFPVTYLNPTCSASFPDPTEQDFFFSTQSQLVAENKTPRENLSRSGGLRVEYVIRGIGFVKSLADLEKAVIKAVDNIPIRVSDVATVTLGPALRRGVLDKAGAETVGGVAVVRYGDNPLAAIERIKEKIKEITPGLPSKTLADGTVSKVTIVPFYDRSGLIYETLGTLKTALGQEILITIIVVLVTVMHFKSSFLVSALLPLAVLMSFIGMKVFGVDANVVALSGIAIAIGTIVDMGIIICENILTKLDEADPEESTLTIIYEAATEVGSAVLTAVATTIVSFLPVFTMQAAEGKLFRPLAYTKTFALIASVVIALTILPPLAHLLFSRTNTSRRPGMIQFVMPLLLVVSGLLLAWKLHIFGLILVGLGIYRLLLKWLPRRVRQVLGRIESWLAILIITLLLACNWQPLGVEKGNAANILFVGIMIGGILGTLQVFLYLYPRLLAWCLRYKALFLVLPLLVTLGGAMVWLGVPRLTAWMPDGIRHSRPVVGLAHSPLVQLADIRYVRGPQMIKSEDTFLTAYVLFDKRVGFAEVDVVEQTKAFLEEKIASGELVLPAGVSYTFAGNYENQIRAQKRLSIILPLSLLVFSAILVAWSGGFLMIWLYGQDWFLTFSMFGTDMRQLFQVHPINLSVAIWVGFLALFGIATDDGVLMVTYLDESRSRLTGTSKQDIRQMVLQGAQRRIRPALMTSATTILALIPILTSSGRGADIMVPMAIPSFGGMIIALLTVFVVPVLYCWVEEFKVNHSR
jgi:Cu/Ag efflux pump CusA